MQFVILDLIKDQNENKVVEFFDELEKKAGTNAFIKLIPVILTDRDPNFTVIDEICFSKITGEERCKLLYSKLRTKKRHDYFLFRITRNLKYDVKHSKYKPKK